MRISRGTTPLGARINVTRSPTFAYVNTAIMACSNKRILITADDPGQA